MFLNKNACDRHLKAKHNEKKDADEGSYLKRILKDLRRNVRIVKDALSRNFPEKIISKDSSVTLMRKKMQLSIGVMCVTNCSITGYPLNAT